MNVPYLLRRQRRMIKYGWVMLQGEHPYYLQWRFDLQRHFLDLWHEE